MCKGIWPSQPPVQRINVNTPEDFAESNANNSTDAFLLGGTLVQPSLSLVGEEQVEPRAIQVLQHLIAAQPNLVSIKELLDVVWADKVVVENVVHQAIARLRRALGDSSNTPTYIKTIPRKGYQLIATVHSTQPQGSVVAEPAEPKKASARWAQRGVVLVALLGLAYVAYSVFAPAMQMPQAPSVQLQALDYDENNAQAKSMAQAIGQDIRDQLARTRLKLVDAADSAKDRGYRVEGMLRRVDVGWRLSVELRDLSDSRVVWLERVDLPEDTQQFDRAPYVARIIESATNTNEVAKVLPMQHPQTKEHYFAASMEWHKLVNGTNGNWQVAINHFERTTILEEDFIPGHMFLATIYANRLGGELDAETALPLAKEHAEKVLAIDPRQTFVRGQVFSFLELAYDAARSYLEAAKQTQIPLGVIEEQLCIVEYTRGALNKAIDHCRTALQMGASPDQVSTLRILARVLGSAERYSEALAAYSEAAKTGGADLIVTGSIWQAALADELNAVELLIDMGDTAGAIQRLEPLLPNQTVTAYPEIFASVLARLGRQEEAKMLLAAAEQRRTKGGHVENGMMFFGYHYLDDAAAAAPWLSRVMNNRDWPIIGQLRGHKLQQAVLAQPLYAAALGELASIEAAAARIPLLP